MPATPAYFHRITEAIEVFQELSAEWVDRRTLEETLGVSKTVAWRIMRRCEATPGPGNTLVCGRADLVRQLQSLRETGEYSREMARRTRVEERLDALVAAARARHVGVAQEKRALALVSTRFQKLPAGVELTPGRLTIDFASTPDFLEKIGAIVFALQNDFDAVSRFIGQG